jgi:hypothetical protein
VLLQWYDWILEMFSFMLTVGNPITVCIALYVILFSIKLLDLENITCHLFIQCGKSKSTMHVHLPAYSYPD